MLASVDGGSPVRRVARTFDVSVSYIYKALIRRRMTGDSAPSPNRGHRPRKLTPAQEAALAARIAEEPDITLARLWDWLAAAHGVVMGSATLWYAVDRLGLSFKKKPERQRTRASGCRHQAAAMAGGTAVHRPRAPGLPRRDRDQHQDGPPLRSRAEG